jgi:hypothetical protein
VYGVQGHEASCPYGLLVYTDIYEEIS